MPLLLCTALLLAGVLAHARSGAPAEVLRTRTRMNVLAACLEEYCRQHGEFPKNPAEILPDRPQFTADEWGRGFALEKSKKDVILTCYGKDGKPGGAGEDADLRLALVPGACLGPTSASSPEKSRTMEEGNGMEPRIIQMVVGKLAVCAYIVGDPVTRRAALVDPAFEVPEILAAAQAAGYTVTLVINTHGHPDHISGNAEALRATGARLCCHRLEAGQVSGLLSGTFARVMGGKGSPKPDILVEDGQTISVGNLEIRVIHTPGHTRGGICLLCGPNVFTGDTLFVNGVGRTDLPGASEKVLAESIRSKLFTLPDETVVWPGHDYGDSLTTTIGREKKENPFVRP
ncbi:MAG: MBL fold metallo-hydrolase [Thermodesulfobacteriota bacterium]